MRTQAPYVKAMKNFLRRPGLSLQAKALLLIIKTFRFNTTGMCFPSMAKIAKAADCSVSTVKRLVEELKDQKFLIVYQMTTKLGKKMSCQYLIDDDIIPVKPPKYRPKQCTAGELRSMPPMSYGDDPKTVTFTEENKVSEESPIRNSLITKCKTA